MQEWGLLKKFTCKEVWIRIKSVHVERKAFKCKDKSFTYKGNLNDFIETVHEGKNPFKCNICDNSYSHRWHFHGHIKSVHEEKKPFTYNDCNADFFSIRRSKMDILNQFMKEKKSSNCNIFDGSNSHKWHFNGQMKSE